MGDDTTRPIERRWGALAVLLHQGGDALAYARRKQSSGMLVSGHSLAGGIPRVVVAPCQRAPSQPTRARPTAVSRMMKKRTSPASKESKSDAQRKRQQPSVA